MKAEVETRARVFWLGRGRRTWLQGELLGRSVEPSNKAAEEVAAKECDGAFITDNWKFDLMPGSRNENRQGRQVRQEERTDG